MSRAKILLVDDNKLIRETLRQGLEMIDLQVVDAVDYEGAVQLLDSTIDLALVDIVLEGKSGLEILSYIHRQYPEIPVIMISGHASKSNAIDALHKGAADYLEKPIRIQELKHVVDRWLSFRSLQAENTSLRKEKQLQDELHESELRYKHIIEHAMTAIYLFDDQMHFMDSNPTGVKLLGYDLDELLAMNISQVDADPEAVKAVHAKLDRGEPLMNYEHKLRCKDGSVITVLNNSMALKDADGRVTNWHSILVDITERKQLEEQLNEQRRSMQAILDNAPVGIWRLGADGHMEFINATFCNAVGIEERCFLEATHYSELLPEDVSRSCIASDKACFDSRAQTFSMEEIPCADGKVHSFEIIKAPILDDQNIMQGLVGLATDITERKQVEQKLQEQMQKLERFNKAAIGREMQMIGLKKEMNALLAEMGREAKYVVHEVKGH